MECAATPVRYRMRVIGVVGDRVAAALGTSVESDGDGLILVGDYVDQAQLTGLINRLYDLHISIQSVEVV